MKKAIFLAFIIYHSAFIITEAQQVNLDSLWGLWNDKAQPDTTRLEAMYKIAKDGYLYSQPDSAFYFAQMQYDFAKRKGIKKQMSGALDIQGASFLIRGDYPKALGYFQRSLKIKEEMGDKNGIARSLGHIGLIYSNQGDYLKALDYYQRSIKISEEMGDYQGKAKCLTNMGNVYNNQADYPKALDYFQRSLKSFEEMGDNQGKADCLMNIGNICTNQADYPKALDYCQRSLKIFEEMGDNQGKAKCLTNMGNIYQSQGDYPKALDYYQRSLKIAEEMGDKQLIPYTLYNMSGIYQSQGDYPKALDYFQRSLKGFEEKGDKYGIVSALNSIGILYQELGDHQKAINQCSKGLLLAQEIEAMEGQKNACQCLYDTYKAMGKGNEALVYLEKMNVINDSMHSEETAKKLQQMDFAKVMLQDSIAQAETDRLVLEAHQEEVRQGEKTRNIALGAGGFLLLLAGGLYTRVRYIRKSKAVLQVEKDRSENLLLNILPEEIAQELKIYGKAEARDFDLVSILFTDFKGFTEASAKMSAGDLVSEINFCFEAFDGIMEKYGIEKIKTIGDAYMAAGGLPVPTDASVKNTMLAALEMQAFVIARKAAKSAKGEMAFEMRVGIHTGPVVAGIVGIKKFQYDIWGDTVNTASRIESNGEAGKVNISQATYELLKYEKDLTFEHRGKIEAKGKGEMEMYFVSLTT